MVQRKLAITFTIDMPQLERLTAVAERERRSRSLIIREAIERELARYEQKPVLVDRGKGSRLDIGLSFAGTPEARSAGASERT